MEEWLKSKIMIQPQDTFENGMREAYLECLDYLTELLYNKNERYVMGFNKKEYDKQYKKDNLKIFKADLRIEELEEINALLKEKGMNKRQFVLKAFEELKKGTIK